MSSNATISDSEDEESSVEVIKTPERSPPAEELTAPQSVLSIRHRNVSKKRSERLKDKDSAEESIAVMVSAPQRPWEYQPYDGDKTVDSIMGRVKGPDGSSWYKIEFESGKKDKVPLELLLQLKQGKEAFDSYQNPLPANPNENTMARTSKRIRTKTATAGYVNSITAHLGSEDETQHRATKSKKRRTGDESPPVMARPSRASGRLASKPVENVESMDVDSDEEVIIGSRRPKRASRSTGKATSKITDLIHDEDEDDDDENEEDEDKSAASASEDDQILFESKKPKKKTARSQPANQKQVKARRGQPRPAESSEDELPEPSRRSGRDRGNIKSMREGDVSEEIYAEETVKLSTAKVLNVKEVFKQLTKDSPFRVLHRNVCDVCSGKGNDSNKGNSPLLYCQGCSTSIHQACIGNRTTREHVVTKVGNLDFVIQCRRCVGAAIKKDRSAPNLACCQGCNKAGLSCKAFSTRLTPKQEEKLREDNEGVDPITNVSPDLVNNANNVLFRCKTCSRAYHFEHLPPLEDDSNSDSQSDPPKDIVTLRDTRFNEYRGRGECKDCLEMTDLERSVSTLVAWRPIAGQDFDNEEDDVHKLAVDKREYLVKWADESYFQCQWMPGAWVHGVTATTMRKAFFKKEDNYLPVYESEDAIPEEYLRMEIVLDVKWKRNYQPKTKSQAKANIHKVKSVLVKFLGLTYDEIVWENPPQPEDDRYKDYEEAYHEYLRGIYFNFVPKGEIDKKLVKFRSLDFEKNVEMKVQPLSLTGGKLMNYQLDGANWMLYNFQQKKNVILADDMGLGKTIQVITFIASLVKENPGCWPFLVVTPNSTCPNWRREIKKWAPDLRVVAFYGSKSSRDAVKTYELYAGQEDKTSNYLTAHVVITSYEGPVDKDSAAFFRSVPWAGLIVDEGQRLKNDANLLYKALTALKTPFQVLLTGTPLQNNKRELFNLLHFLDPTKDAAKLDEKYAELTKENVPELHELIKPFFLRRTKAEVLTTLPPMAQVIIPVTMSFLQKKVYKSILEKNLDLIKTVLGEGFKKIRVQDRGNLNNILMQLRKVLSHPFLYSRAIEERTNDPTLEFRNLVDASSKFKLLEIMLPKLKQRGHRVLLFSQFLDQLDHIEDFLAGLDLNFRRLDGNMSTLRKQKVIDEYNATGSEVFAMLLSTRAGGVGINLATADTVIIMDPDYNPHQDNQALSRAHRIGQTKPVLVFNLMTKNSAEEKIIQSGRQKLALGALIETNMGGNEETTVDVESILKHGAAALFKEDGDNENDIHYDSAAVDKLLDRTTMPENNTKAKNTSENKFSFAKIWVNDKGTLSDDIGNADDMAAQISESAWQQIMLKREREVKEREDAEKLMVTEGRPKRGIRVNYNNNNAAVDAAVGPDEDASPAKPIYRKKKPNKGGSDSDNDFSGRVSDEGPEEDHDFDEEGDGPVDLTELTPASRSDTPRGLLTKAAVATSAAFSRHEQQLPSYVQPPGRTVGTFAGVPPAYGPSGRGGAGHVPGFSSQPGGGSAFAIHRNEPRERTGPVRNPIQRPDHLMQRNNSGYSVTPGTSLSLNRPSAPCFTCKLEHQDISRKCPRTMSNSKIRMLLDGLETTDPKALTLYNQLRWILAARAEKKLVRP